MRSSRTCTVQVADPLQRNGTETLVSRAALPTGVDRRLKQLDVGAADAHSRRRNMRASHLDVAGRNDIDLPVLHDFLPHLINRSHFLAILLLESFTDQLLRQLRLVELLVHAHKQVVVRALLGRAGRDHGAREQHIIVHLDALLTVQKDALRSQLHAVEDDDAVSYEVNLAATVCGIFESVQQVQLTGLDLEGAAEVYLA